MPGMGHAEAAAGQELVDRIGRWIGQAIYQARLGGDRDDAATQTPNAAA